MIKENTIYNESNQLTLERMPDNYLDLTVTSPPYNVDLGKNKFNKNPYDLYKDNKEHQEYLRWLETIFTPLYFKTKAGGRCVINIGDGQNGKIPTHSDIMQMMKHIGWLPLTTIIWDKNSASSRTAWGSFKSPACPSFPTPFEYILVFAKQSYKLQSKGLTDLTNEQFVKWSLASWNFPGVSAKKTGHPAAYPIELPLRCIKMFSWIGGIVYDPFMGSGTTAIAAIRTNRKYIGSELSPQYYSLIQEYLHVEWINS